MKLDSLLILMAHAREFRGTDDVLSKAANIFEIAFAPYRDRTLSSITSAINGAESPSSSSEMNLAVVSRFLNGVGGLCRTAGAKTAADGLTKLAETLAKQPYGDIEGLASAIGQARSGARRGRAAKRTEPEERPDVQHYVFSLNQVVDQTGLESVLNRIKTDKALRLPDIVGIARAYSGSEIPLRSKSAAVSRIEKSFVERARFRNKLAT